MCYAEKSGDSSFIGNTDELKLYTLQNWVLGEYSVIC